MPGPAEHFEWHINYSEIFQEKGGFDVVICFQTQASAEKYYNFAVGEGWSSKVTIFSSLNSSLINELDIHIHIPSGAIPEDGPSAGITIAVALISLLTGKPARNDIALTGELTLSGRILGVSGIREKILCCSAKRNKNRSFPQA